MARATDESEAMSPQAAAAEIERIQRLDGALRRRTSALTWMIWGLAGPAIFVTYSVLGLIVEDHAPDAWPLFFVGWLPWTLMGVLATRALWNSVGLVIPVDAARDRREGWAFGAVVLLLIWGGFYATKAVGLELVEPAWVLIALGATAIMVHVLGIMSCDATERRTWLVAGVFMIVVAIVAALVVGPDPDAQYAWFTLIGPVTSAAGYFGGGLFLAARA